KKLERPNHYLECQILNIYQEIIEYLKTEFFAGKSLFDSIIEKEKEDPSDADHWVRQEIEGGFYPWLQAKIQEHFTGGSEKRVYLLIHGFGSAYPYLRASDFL